MDDHGNVLNSGKPVAEGGGDSVPDYGGARAREQLWQVLVSTKNTTMKNRWRASCDSLKGLALGKEEHTHDEL